MLFSDINPEAMQPGISSHAHPSGDGHQKEEEEEDGRSPYEYK